MYIDDYLDFVKSVSMNPSIEHEFSGLVEEVGELAGHIKRLYRDKKNYDREAVKKELGDIYWYLTKLTDDFGFLPSDVLTANVAKLTDRAERRVLRGSGDNR